MLQLRFIDCIHKCLVFHLLDSHLRGILLRLFLGIARTGSGRKPFDTNLCLEDGITVMVEELLDQLKGNLHLVLLAPFDKLGLEVNFFAGYFVQINITVDDPLLHKLLATFIPLIKINGSDKCFESIPVHITVVGRGAGRIFDKFVQTDLHS